MVVRPLWTFTPGGGGHSTEFSTGVCGQHQETLTLHYGTFFANFEPYVRDFGPFVRDIFKKMTLR